MRRSQRSSSRPPKRIDRESTMRRVISLSSISEGLEIPMAFMTAAVPITIVVIFNGTNSLANAYQVEPDVIPDPD